NVPLGDTSDLTLTVQDVMNNTATMSLTVYDDEDAGLSIDPATGDLWESTATITGTIGDDSYVVTVNGVQATNDGYGGWTAYGVPINDGNMAVFNAVASLPDSEGARAGGRSMAMFGAM